jgi:hypothetical protein
MIAYINGVMVQGSPEEIEQFRMINAEKKTSTRFFNIPASEIPEHVKKYWEPKQDYRYDATKGQTHRVWF